MRANNLRSVEKVSISNERCQQGHDVLSPDAGIVELEGYEWYGVEEEEVEEGEEAIGSGALLEDEGKQIGVANEGEGEQY